MPNPISLNGSWILHWMPVSPDPLPFPPADLETQSSIPAQVPGNAELDLERAGLLPDPFFGANIRQLRPLENREWWYSKHFVVPDEFSGQRSELVFEGLDTLATVWLNGQCIGQAENMLIPQRFETTTAVLPGVENTLVVRLSSAMVEAKKVKYEPGMMSWEHRSEGLRLRKASHVWGWDIMPRVVSAGIWRRVHLQIIPEHAIEGLYIWTVEAQPEHAILGVWYDVRTSAELEGLHLVIRGACGRHSFQHEWPLEFIADQFSIQIENPCLWWPTGYGEANLYEITFQLRSAESVLAERKEWVGVRKIKILRTEACSTPWQHPLPAALPAQVDQPVEADSHFTFLVNDQMVMVKGTNWVPLDAFHSRDAERMTRAIEMVSELGCNMIRCWGGNVYEADAFFEWCDSHGIMVWQDFAFACCIYPQDDEFLKTVQHEVQSAVERLRNHASLAVWCGDNEVDMAYASQGRDPQYNRLTRQAIPQMLQRFDPHRAYIPSSPFISAAALNQSSSDTAEQHLWGPRGYYKGDFYTRHSAHFIGEIGYHGCPAPTSVAKFISPEQLWPPDGSDEWQIHSVYHWRTRTIERDRVALMTKQVRILFGFVPENLTEYAIASQIVQAEALKFFVESTRLRKWHTSGILWWNLLDGWPQFSDAVVDYFFTKKLAYHYLYRVQRPVLVCLGESERGSASGTAALPVIVCNDSLEDVKISYRIWDANRQRTLAEGKFKSPANQNWQVAKIQTQDGSPQLFLMEWQANGENFGNHYLFGEPPLDLERYIIWLKKIAALPRPFPLPENLFE